MTWDFYEWNLEFSVWFSEIQLLTMRNRFKIFFWDFLSNKGALSFLNRFGEL